MELTLTVNGAIHHVAVEGWESLLDVLREQLELRGAKDACLQGECGACTVLLDGELRCACLVLAADAQGSQVTTVEGLGTPDRPHPVQTALAQHGAVQCGYCTPGFVVAIDHLLRSDPAPSRDDVRERLAGNLCRCTGYGAIARTVAALASDEPVPEVGT